MEIPLKQSDIKLNDFLKYQEYIKNLNDNDKKNYKKFYKETVKIFYHLDDKELLSFKYNTLIDMYKIIENILNTKQEVVLKFEIENVKYGLNPNFNDITFGEMVDCDTEDILRQICILYIPIIKEKGEKYLIKPYDANIDIYETFKKELTLDIYNGFIAFFLKIQQGFMIYIQKSLTEMDITPDQKKILEGNGDGFLGYMNYVQEIYQSKIKY